MKLHQLFIQATCPEEEAHTYSALELYLGLGSPSGWSSHRKGISTAYNPDYYNGNGTGEHQTLRLLDFPFFMVNRQELNTFVANPSAHLLRFFSYVIPETTQMRVILHPDALKQLPIIRKPDGMIHAYLTVATRTVLTAYDHAPLFLKLDYPGIIGRCPRRLDLPQLHTSTFFSHTLDEWSQAGFLSKTFGYLPESVGLLWKFAANQPAVGLIGREFVPRPHVNEHRFCIPFFALPSHDRAHPDEPSLLTQIIRLTTSTSRMPRDVFLHITALIFEAIRSLFQLGQSPNGNAPGKFRVVHDCHAQNVLLELNREGMPCRIVFRDFQHFYPVIFDDSSGVGTLVDRNPFCKILDLRTEPDYVQRKISQLIDHKLSMYTIRPLIDDFCENFECDRNILLGQVRHQFHTILAELHAILPKGRWYRRSDGMEYDQRGRIRLVQGEGMPLLRE